MIKSFRCFVFLVGILLFCCLESCVVPAANDTLVTFDGVTKTFVFEKDSDANAVFSNIAPGETKSLTFQLKNSYQDSLKFYFSAKTLEDLQTLKTAAYHIVITQDKKTLFENTYGSGTSSLIDFNTDKDSNASNLIAVVEPGKEVPFTFSISLDGSSCSNEYQNCSGQFQFTFRTQLESDSKTESPKKNTTTSLLHTPLTSSNSRTLAVKTGDFTPLECFFSLFTISSILLISLFIYKKKCRNR